MGSLHIIQSVGIGGKNDLNDIKTVQTSLNTLLHLIPPTKLLVVDGKLGFKPENSKTVGAITLFQKKVVGIVRPDGKIDVNGKTHKKINEKLIAIKSKTPVPTTEALKAKLRSKLEQYEGRVEHMYLDTKGFVTVGVGHMMPSSEEAKKVAFINAVSGAAATKKEIEDEFALIKSKPFGAAYNYRRFKSYTKLKLSDSTINEITNKHIVIFEGELKRIYGAAEFKTHPKNVKLTLFDMIFNLGMRKLNTRYPKFNKYIKANDYKNSALESNKKGVAAERNLYVKNLLSKSNE